MIKSIVRKAIPVLLVLLIPISSSASEKLTAEKILNRVDDLFRGSSSHGTMTMKVVTSHYTREMKLEAWSLGKKYSLIRVLEPRRERGVATLRAGDNIWNYLPGMRG